MEPKTPWMGEYVWEENKCDGSEPKCVPLPDEVIAMFRPSKCLLCGTVTNNQQSAFTHYESKGHFKKVAQHMREKYNVLGTLKSKEKFQPVRCEVCQIDITSRIVLMQHYEGKQHLKNLKKKADGVPVVEVKDGTDAPTTTSVDFENPMDFLKDLPPPPPLPKLGIYFCSLCQMKTKSKSQMEIHNNGSRHLKNLSKLADGELKEFFLRNGNCEPVETEAQDPTPPSTPASDSQVSSYPQQAGTAVGGYGYPPMGMPMVPPGSYPPVPYGPYPQYPMGYDYNSWNQGQQGYNGQPTYNAQQPYGQMYNGSYPYPYNPHQYPNQQYPDNQQQYSATATSQPFVPPPFVPPQNFTEPCPAAPGTTDTPISISDAPSTETTTTPSAPVTSGAFGKRKKRTAPKDPEVRESPVPDNFEMKPLAVSDFVKLLAQEAKLGNDSNPSANPHSATETAEPGTSENAFEGDSVNPAVQVEETSDNEVMPAGKKDNPANIEVESVGIELESSSADSADVGGNTDPPAVAAPNTSNAEILVQDEVNDDSNIEDVTRTSPVSDESGKNEKMAHSPDRPDEDSKISGSPSTQEHKADGPGTGEFVATGFTETNVRESSEPPVENLSTTDAFKFKIGVNSGKPTLNYFFKRSTEKMLKEAKEKKRLEDFQKLKEHSNEPVPADVQTNTGVENGSDSFDSLKESDKNTSKKQEKQKLDKSDGEISDDHDAALSVQVTDSAKNSSTDHAKPQEEDEKNANKDEKVQIDAKDKEKVESSKKKFSASDKKKVSRTRNSSVDSKKSRSRSRSRRRRSSKRRSSSWNPSSEDEMKTHRYGKGDYGQDNNYQNYYGYNNRNRNWRNNRGYYHNNRGFHHRNYWDHQRYSWDNQEDYYEREVEETDEFGREKKRRDDKKEKRESRKRKKERRSPSAASLSSRSSSGSKSRKKSKRKSDKKRKSSKKEVVGSADGKSRAVKTPEIPVGRVSVSQLDVKQTPLTLAEKLRIAKSDRIRVAAQKKELAEEVEEDLVPVAETTVQHVAKKMPELVEKSAVVDKVLPQKPILPQELLHVLEKEREKQEILKKMALIKMKLEQKNKEKSSKKKKKKKTKAKKRKRSLSTSSSLSSSSASSSSSSSSNSSSSSSQSESLAEKLLAKMKKESKAVGPSSVLPDLAKVLPLLKKNEPEFSKKKKRKKDKKAKRKKSKSRKEPSQSSFASYITPSGHYYCKYCNSTYASGNVFIEHLLTEKHKLMYKLVKEKGA